LEAADQRYRAFKLSPFRQIKLFDFEPATENVGELIKPTVSEGSRVFRKAEYIINLRKVIADELVKREEEMITKVNDSKQTIDPTKVIRDLKCLIDELD
jgi:hypothetical protein